MKLFAFILLMALSGICARGDVASNFTPAGTSMTYTAGSITVNSGTLQTINAGTLTSFAASQNNCSVTAILAGTDACEYVYYPGTGTALAHTTTLETALPYLLAAATTDASGNVTSVGALVLASIQPVTQVLLYENCKTTTTCAQTDSYKHVLVTGTISLVSGTVTITTLPFANANYRCFTQAAHFTTVTKTSSTSVTFNGTGSDSVDWQCVGKSQ